MEKSAIKFYKEIEREKDKYKLVNGLFIVKYINKDICVYVGDFLKSGCADKKTNLVLIKKNNQMFDKKRRLATTSLGVWKKLNINFIEKPIGEILK